ncbi:P-loop containing nucleoside triphosphate hydrolase [Pseudocohnilembus persalinus]|uniref:p-loop containing nucleoside triphosphate hydrolase n=1 Tax=Pseudocohnilembus persalinus TaxID=266149 RepID=A0A0V0QQ11_PSEPJ|nr:P-loop containing nucleoside triphosphate hydrolase [Pseudocohnilembus persalinus]|eukprot:KRX04451.1 P-loop containing nucleoside triphosphate hydrolase [Pseudocohnilembus persalinus]
MENKSMSIDNFLDVTYQKFFSNQSKINDLISQMNAQNLNTVEIQSLKLVFMGEQSVGKSTALTHLMGKENIVPIKSDLGTKLATKVVFKKGNKEEVTIFLEGQDDKQKSVFQKDEYKKIQQKVLDLNESCGGEISDKHVIVIEYSGQKYNLEFYDLPGLRMDQQYKNKTENIAKKYIQDPNSIILFCNSTDNNQSNAPLLFHELSEQRAQDTVVVLTKIDKGDTNVQNALQFLKQREKYKFAGYIIIVPRENKANQYGDLPEPEFLKKEQQILDKELTRNEEQRIKDLNEASKKEKDILGKKKGLKQYNNYCGKEQGLKQIYNIQFKKIIEANLLQNSLDLIKSETDKQKKDLKNQKQQHKLLTFNDQEYYKNQKDKFNEFYKSRFKVAYFNIILGSEFQQQIYDMLLNFAYLLHTVKDMKFLIHLMLKNSETSLKYRNYNKVVQWILQKKKVEFEKCFEPLLENIKQKYKAQYSRAFEKYKIDQFVQNDEIIVKYVNQLFQKIQDDFKKIIEVDFQLDFIQEDYDVSQCFMLNKNAYENDECYYRKESQEEDGGGEENDVGEDEGEDSGEDSGEDKNKNYTKQQVNKIQGICQQLNFIDIEINQQLFDHTSNLQTNCQISCNNVDKIGEKLKIQLEQKDIQVEQIQKDFFQDINVFEFKESLQNEINSMIEDIHKTLNISDQQPKTINQSFKKDINEVMMKTYLYFIDEVKGIYKQLNKIIYNHTKNFKENFFEFVFNKESKIWEKILQVKQERIDEDLQTLEETIQRQEQFVQNGIDAMELLKSQIDYVKKVSKAK